MGGPPELRTNWTERETGTRPYRKHKRRSDAGYLLRHPASPVVEMPLTVPRDRDGSFEPELVKKGQTRIDGVEVQRIGIVVAI